MNRQSLEHAVSLTLADHAGDFDITAIADELTETYGPLTSIDDVDSDAYWAIVEKHDATRVVHYRIEIGSNADRRIWQLEHDDAHGTAAVGPDAATTAQEILDNRVSDLTADDAVPDMIRVRLWRTADDADLGHEPIAEAVHAAV